MNHTGMQQAASSVTGLFWLNQPFASSSFISCGMLAMISWHTVLELPLYLPGPSLAVLGPVTCQGTARPSLPFPPFVVTLFGSISVVTRGERGH